MPQNNNQEPRLYALLFIIVLAMVATLFFGCNSDKHIAKMQRKYCVGKDSITVIKRDTVITRDTVFFLVQTGDTITLPCAEKDTVIVRKNAGIVTKVIYKDKKVQCICADDSLRIVIAKIRADHFTEIEETKNSIIKVKDCEETWWQKLYRVGFWVLLSLCVIMGIKYVIQLMAWLRKIMP